MKPTTHLFLSSIAAGCTALLVSCASTQTTTQNRESMLVASGFKVITPKTAAQKQKLQNLPAGAVTMIKNGKKNYYVFPDPAHNLAYVGGPKEYKAYQQLRADKEARQGRSPGRGDVSGRHDGVESVGRWRRSVGTHGRTGTVLEPSRPSEHT